MLNLDMRYFKYSSLIFMILYVQIWAFVGIYFSVTYSEIVQIIVVGLIIYAIFYFTVRFIKLDFYFSQSNLKTKSITLAAIILFGALFISSIYSEAVFALNLEFTNKQLNYLTLIIVESVLIITLLIWFLTISLYEMAKDLISRAESEIPGILEKGSEITKDVAGKIKKSYDESSFPIRNKLRKEKLLAELAELQEVEPEKRNFHKSDYQSKSEDIKQINPLERELRVKKLKKQIEELEND